MNRLLSDLYGHQTWADAEHWRAIESHPAAAVDGVIRDRLHHIYLVQRAFRWIVGSREPMFQATKPSDFPSLAALKADARSYHEEMRALLAAVPVDRLEETIDVPWFQDPPLTLTVSEALTQCAMHSHYHRGQNATRLRELGGEPPLTDLIVWYWKGRPAAEW
jgi:uncharacterized damage-inducible protein DinB